MKVFGFLFVLSLLQIYHPLFVGCVEAELGAVGIETYTFDLEKDEELAEISFELIPEIYERDGIVFPLRVFDEEKASEAAAKHEQVYASDASSAHGTDSLRSSPHLLFTWVAEIVSHPKILDAVETVYGPNILLWSANFFTKRPNSAGFVSWHQDSTYWGLDRPDVVTAWIAITPSNTTSGCMEVILGTHTIGQQEHHDTWHENNLLTRGQAINVDVDEADAVCTKLDPGQFSLHHVRLVHGSKPNRSSFPRIGIAARYIPTDVSPLKPPDYAILVRGEDKHKNFLPGRFPKESMDEDALAFHKEVVERKRHILFPQTKLQENTETNSTA